MEHHNLRPHKARAEGRRSQSPAGEACTHAALQRAPCRRRTVFKPLRARGLGPFAASVGAFGASGAESHTGVQFVRLCTTMALTRTTAAGLLHCYLVGAMGHVGAADLGTDLLALFSVALLGL